MVNMTILRRHGELYLVKVAHAFHVVLYDEEIDMVAGIYSGDRIAGRLKKAKGFDPKSIRSVSKGRKEKTATAYWGTVKRAIERASEKDGQFANLK